MRWLAAEPYRVFFALGAVWSMVGVTLWPLFYQGMLPFYPLTAHARLMMEGFAGAFVAGFLGTAGPRVISAPGWTVGELTVCVALHTGCAGLHLAGWHGAGDMAFTLFLAVLGVGLLVRGVRLRGDAPPPQALLVLTGLVLGAAGAVMLALPATAELATRSALASLLLYQGLLLPPVLGVGSYLFPRMLGGDFGEPGTPAEAKRQRLRAAVAALLLAGSFPLEVYGSQIAGCLLRVLVCTLYLGAEVRWRAGTGTLANGLKIALGLGAAGLFLSALVRPDQRISVDHLLYVDGFGLLMLIVASRVLLGHSGHLAVFGQRSRMARWIIGLTVLAGTTRATIAWLPHVAVSHYQYAAGTWVVVILLWLAWSRRWFLEE